MRKKILITGHTGHLGSYLYDYLSKQYNCKGFKNLKTYVRINFIYIHLKLMYYI